MGRIAIFFPKGGRRRVCITSVEGKKHSYFSNKFVERFRSRCGAKANREGRLDFIRNELSEGLNAGKIRELLFLHGTRIRVSLALGVVESKGVSAAVRIACASGNGFLQTVFRSGNPLLTWDLGQSSLQGLSLPVLTFSRTEPFV